jgi:signal transduction histidine kinase
MTALGQRHAWHWLKPQTRPSDANSVSKTLYIVHLEDNPRDAELVRSLLEAAGINCRMRVVHSHPDFERELKAENIDLILSDFSLPSYDGITALKFARERRPEIPFIFVSGKIGEESAVESLQNGASDYLIKDRLARLPAAVERAVREAEDRKKRKEAERALKEQEEKMFRTQRLESLGTLAGGIAHDLNNVLLPMMLGLEVFRGKLSSKSDQEIISMLEKGVARASSLVKQVLTFARGGEGQRLLLDPAHLLRDIAQIAQRTFSSAIAVRCNVPKDLQTIEGDPTQIHQILLNLVVNARDAMPKGGTLSIVARNVGASEVSHRFSVDALADYYVLMEVSDTGDGIAPEIQDRIFEPFFTTKAPGQGTGLGLSTTLGIIKAHAALIDFQSKAGQGTTFRVYFPARGSGREARPVAPPAPEISGLGEVVLIIDDEPGVRELTKAILGRHAYQVLTAENGAEGVSIFTRFRERIDVVIADKRMPLMGGPEAVRAIRRVKPSIRIIAMTGETSILGETGFDVEEVDAFLPKPFTAEQLLASLNKFVQQAG